MRFRLVLAPMLAVVTVVTAAGCGGSGGGPSAPIIPSTPANPVATTSVSLQDDLFSPANILVAPSAVVTFNNASGLQHNVIFESQGIAPIGEWTSGTRTAAMPAAPGTYPFFCTIHPGMSGTVKVQ